MHPLLVAGNHLEFTPNAVLDIHDQLRVLVGCQGTTQIFYRPIAFLQAGAGLEYDLVDKGLQTGATGKGRYVTGLIYEGVEKLLGSHIGKGLPF
jgi:hypothetical protein